jgi:hypothetical protein
MMNETTSHGRLGQKTFLDRLIVTDAGVDRAVGVVDGTSITVIGPGIDAVPALLTDLPDLIMAGITIAGWGLPPQASKEMEFIDLQTESKMILNSHPEFIDTDFGDFPRERCLRAFGTVNLVECLYRISAMHKLAGTPWCLDQAIERGRYILALTILRLRSSGLAVNTQWWSRVLTHRLSIKAVIAQEVAKAYPGSRFWRQDTDRSIHFDPVAFAEFVESKGWDRGWKRLADGKLALDRDTLDQQIKNCPELRLFKQGRDAIMLLGTIRLNWDASGCVFPGSTPFHTKTGRNQPLVRQGFIFNMAPAFRVGGIRLAPGRALIALDWSKQEPAIAIGRSGDANYLAAYEADDLYLDCARRAGAVPDDATKHSHPEERQAFKAAMLAIGYGMKTRSLAAKIYTEVNARREAEVMSRAEASEKAEAIMEWYDREFHILQAYLEAEHQTARKRKFCVSPDGWIAFLSPSYSRRNQLINFPIQSAGATMLRHAIKLIAFKTDLDVCQTLHDAIYINCAMEDVDKAIAMATEQMRRAAALVTDVEIAIEAKVVTEDRPLEDERAEPLLTLINHIIGVRELSHPCRSARRLESG